MLFLYLSERDKKRKETHSCMYYVLLKVHVK